MKKMNTTKKILVALAVMMVAAAMAAQVAMGDDVSYSATVGEGQSTAVTVGPTAFPAKLAGETSEITDSLTLTNVGNKDAAVSAKFTSQAEAAGANDYGLVGSTDLAATKVLIDGTNFKLGDTIGTPSTMIALLNTVDPQALGAANNVPKTGGSITYDAQLNIPAGQEADSYTGTVELSFTDAA